MREFFGISKPSQAIRAMLKGLETGLGKSDFQVDMSSFGYVDDEGICHGCAAVCALQTLAGRWFTAEDYQTCTADPNSNLNTHTRLLIDTGHAGHVIAFEVAIDHLRGGQVGALFRFFNMDAPVDTPSLPRLQNYNNWEDNLHYYEAYATQLETMGL